VTSEAEAHLVEVPRRASIAMAEDVARQLEQHLLRPDGQEDLIFARYRRSSGRSRDSYILTDLVEPEPGDRAVHGNASFSGDYFLRAAGLAAEQSQGVALLHSHPGGSGWQGLSHDDDDAERGHAVQASILTGLPLVGLTLAGRDKTFSARAWPVVAGEPPRLDGAESVRVVGSRIVVHHNPKLRPEPRPTVRTERTVSAWGTAAQGNLVRLRVAIVGAGSVGAVVGEILARTGFRDVVVIDFDNVEERNLDRLLPATMADAVSKRSKAELLAVTMAAHAADPDAAFTYSRQSIVEPAGWAEAMDCDVIFSCVDRPWPRHVLNLAAYTALIPVVDGGIAVDVCDGRLLGAEWRSHIAAPGRRCLSCIGQFDPADVAVEQAGLLDDPTYIEGLPADHHLRRGENVMAFSAACGSHEVLDLLRAVLGPNKQYDIGATLHHWTIDDNDHDTDGCREDCLYDAEVYRSSSSVPTLSDAGHARARRVREQSGTRPMRGTINATATPPVEVGPPTVTALIRRRVAAWIGGQSG